MHPEIMCGVRAADVIMAADADCVRWIRAYRHMSTPAPGAAERPERGERRRRRGGERRATA
jgi:hypothetical protein